MAGFIREQIVKRFTRSGSWSKVRKLFIRQNNYCAVCGKKKGLQVHHIVPFHINPDMELDPLNLITLCARHHFIFGHLGYWKSWNINVLTDCLKWRFKYEGRP